MNAFSGLNGLVKPLSLLFLLRELDLVLDTNRDKRPSGSPIGTSFVDLLGRVMKEDRIEDTVHEVDEDTEELFLEDVPPLVELFSS